MNFTKTIALIPDGFEVKVFPDSGVPVTGSLLRENSRHCAAWLQEQGYKTIGIHMGNCPEFLYLFAGAMCAGVKAALFNALKPIESKLPVFTQEMVREILHGPKKASYTEYEWKLDEPILILTSSGTSGDRKEVEKSIKDFFGQRGFRPMWRIGVGLLSVKMYNCSPWYHNTGIYSLLISLFGVMFTEITSMKFNPNSLRLSLNSTCPQILLCTPTMLTRCVDSGDLILPPYMICSGERMPKAAIQVLEERFHSQFIYNGYGTTETELISNLIYLFDSVKIWGKALAYIFYFSGLVGSLFDRKTLIPDCTGKILKNTKVRIMKNGIEQAEGSFGEITVSNKNTISKTEYYYTGDIGYVKGDLLFVTGRKSSVINRSGEKILPSDIELVIGQIEGVQSVSVFGIPSYTHGEDICAAVETEEGRRLFEKEDLAGKLSKFMLPQMLIFLKEFPVNASGKTDIMALKALAEKTRKGGRECRE